MYFIFTFSWDCNSYLLITPILNLDTAHKLNLINNVDILRKQEVDVPSYYY